MCVYYLGNNGIIFNDPNVPFITRCLSRHIHSPAELYI